MVLQIYTAAPQIREAFAKSATGPGKTLLAREALKLANGATATEASAKALLAETRQAQDSAGSPRRRQKLGRTVVRKWSEMISTGSTRCGTVDSGRRRSDGLETPKFKEN